MNRSFSFEKLDLDGAVLIQPFMAIDQRGSFIKDYSKEVFEANQINHDLKEVFYTSSYSGVIRGLHFQRVNQQPKLVRCISGKIFDVIVDLRKESSTFGQWRGFNLSEENANQLYIPKFFGHGFLAIKPSVVVYKCAEQFYPEYDDGIRWDDPDLNIQWPLNEVDHHIILSDKDQQLQSFKEFVNR